uniref:Uncharacterized protein n=1 Tax=Fagus sylvatica TaxID=28930 RepID=A0A2N9EVM7_FAGSY
MPFHMSNMLHPQPSRATPSHPQPPPAGLSSHNPPTSSRSLSRTRSGDCTIADLEIASRDPPPIASRDPPRAGLSLAPDLLGLWVFRDGGFVGFPMVGLRWIIGGLRWWVCCDGGFVGFPMVVCGGLSVDCGGGFAVMVGLWVCGFAVMVGLWVFRWWFAVDCGVKQTEP